MAYSDWSKARQKQEDSSFLAWQKKRQSTPNTVTPTVISPTGRSDAKVSSVNSFLSKQQPQQPQQQTLSPVDAEFLKWQEKNQPQYVAAQKRWEQDAAKLQQKVDYLAGKAEMEARKEYYQKLLGKNTDDGHSSGLFGIPEPAIASRAAGIDGKGSGHSHSSGSFSADKKTASTEPPELAALQKEYDALTAEAAQVSPNTTNWQNAWWVPENLREQENARVANPARLAEIQQRQRELEEQAYSLRVEAAQNALREAGLERTYDELRLAEAYKNWELEANTAKGGDLGEVEKPDYLKNYTYDAARVAQLRKRLENAGIDYALLKGYEDAQYNAAAGAYRRQEWERGAAENPVYASLATVPVAAIQGLDLVNMIPYIGHTSPRKLGSYVPMDQNQYMLSDFVSSVRGAVAKDIEEKTDWEAFGTNVASFLYQTGMSVADSATQIYLMGLGEAATYAMGTAAAANGARETLERGGTSEQAFWNGLAQGVAEGLFEKFSIENLIKFKNVDGLKGLMLETGKQMLTEASEEMATEIANILSDALIMGGKSNWETAVRAYMNTNRGMTRKEAERLVLRDNIQQVVLAGAGGALSGGMMGGVQNSYTAINNRQMGMYLKATGLDEDIISTALTALPKDSDSYKAASRLPASPSAMQIGALYGTLEQDLSDPAIRQKMAEARVAESERTQAGPQQAQAAQEAQVAQVAEPAVDTAAETSYTGPVEHTMQAAVDAYSALTGANRMKESTAKQKAAIIQKVWQGAMLTPREVRALNLADAEMRSVFNGLTGLSLDETTNRFLNENRGAQRVAAIIQQDMRVLNEAQTAEAEVAQDLESAEAVAAEAAAEEADAGASIMQGAQDAGVAPTPGTPLVDPAEALGRGAREAGMIQTPVPEDATVDLNGHAVSFEQYQSFLTAASEANSVAAPSEEQARQMFNETYRAQHPMATVEQGGNTSGESNTETAEQPGAEPEPGESASAAGENSVETAGANVSDNELQGRPGERAGEQDRGVPEVERGDEEKSAAPAETGPEENRGGDQSVRAGGDERSARSIEARLNKLKGLKLKTAKADLGGGVTANVLDKSSQAQVRKAFSWLRSYEKIAKAMGYQVQYVRGPIRQGTLTADGLTAPADKVVYLQVDTRDQTLRQLARHELVHMWRGVDAAYDKKVTSLIRTIHDNHSGGKSFARINDEIRNKYDTKTGYYGFLGDFAKNFDSYYEEILGDVVADRLREGFDPNVFRALQTMYKSMTKGMNPGGAAEMTAEGQPKFSASRESGSAATNEALAKALELLHNGHTVSEVFNETGLVVNANGIIQNGLGGEVIGRYAHAENAKGSYDKGGEATGPDHDGRRAGGLVEDGRGEVWSHARAPWNQLRPVQRQQLTKAVASRMAQASEEGKLLRARYDSDAAFAKAVYARMTESDPAAEAWSAFIPDMQGLLRTVDKIVGQPKLLASSDAEAATDYNDPAIREALTHDPKYANLQHKDLAFIVDASDKGVALPLNRIRNTPSVRAAERRVEQLKGRSSLEENPVSPAQREQLITELLDSQHGSYVDGDDYSGPVATDRIAFIVLGRPGGGKSDVFAKPLSRDNQARIIDSDDVKPRLNGYENGIGTGYVQEESAGIVMEAMYRAIHAGENIVIPRVGSTYQSIDDLINDLRGEGYTVQLYLNEISPRTGYTRTAARFARTGRFIDYGYQKSIGSTPTQVFRRLMNDERVAYTEWRNNDVKLGEEPTLRYRTGKAVRDTFFGRNPSAVREITAESERAVSGNGESVDRRGPVGRAVGPKFSASSTTESEASSAYQSVLADAISFMKDAGFEVSKYYEDQLQQAMTTPFMSPAGIMDDIFENAYHPELTEEQKNAYMQLQDELDALAEETQSDAADDYFESHTAGSDTISPENEKDISDYTSALKDLITLIEKAGAGDMIGPYYSLDDDVTYTPDEWHSVGLEAALDAAIESGKLTAAEKAQIYAGFGGLEQLEQKWEKEAFGPAASAQTATPPGNAGATDADAEYQKNLKTAVDLLKQAGVSVPGDIQYGANQPGVSAVGSYGFELDIIKQNAEDLLTNLNEADYTQLEDAIAALLDAESQLSFKDSANARTPGNVDLNYDPNNDLPSYMGEVEQEEYDAQQQIDRSGFTSPEENEELAEFLSHDDSGELHLPDGQPKILISGANHAGKTTEPISWDKKKSPGLWMTGLPNIARSYAKGAAHDVTTQADMAARELGYGADTAREMPLRNASSWDDAINYVDEYYASPRIDRTTGEIIGNNGLSLVPMSHGQVVPLSEADSIQLRSNLNPDYDDRRPTAAKPFTTERRLAEWPATQSGLDRFNHEIGDLATAARAGKRGYSMFYGKADNTLVIDAKGDSFTRIPLDGLPEAVRKAHPLDSPNHSNTSFHAHVNDLVRRAFDAGYDLVVIKDVLDAGDSTYDLTEQIQYAFRDPGRQLKSVYNETFSDPNNFKFSATSDGKVNTEDVISEFDAQHGEGSAQAIIDLLAQQVRRYGAQRPTANAVRDAQMPNSTGPNNRVSRTPGTVVGAQATPENRVLDIKQAVVYGKMSYEPIENKVLERWASRRMKLLGWGESLRQWQSAVRSGRASAELAATGATLLNNAGNNNASAAEYLDILSDYAQLLRNAGQAVQAANILKKMTPEGRLYEVQRTVDKLNEQIAEKQRGRRDNGTGTFDPASGEFEGIKIDPALVEAFQKAKTDAERDAILDLMAQNVADQLVSSPLDLWTAWRYLNMLGNFRTQIRNVAGNTFFQPVRMLKDSMVGVTEALLKKAGVDIDRTSSVRRDAETWKAAHEVYQEYRETILAGGKYQDDVGRNFSGRVKARQRIFDHTQWQLFNKTAGKALEGYRQATNWAMDTGDAVFCEFTFRDSLSRFMAANHTTWSEASESLRTRAVNKAVRDAAEATYRDNNALSIWLSQLARGESTPKIVKTLAEGIVPFRKTPANILVRAYEYSPLSIIGNTITDIKAATGRKDVSANQIVEQWAKTFTGTGLVALGYALAAMGKLIGKAPDDEKEKALFDQQGKQAYSLVANGHTFTLDWLAPEAIPLFLGANIAQAAMEGGFSLKEGMSAVMAIGDPILQMSMLQGVNDALENASSYGDDSALMSFIANAAWGYLTQGITNTLVGQLERGLQGNQRVMTYVDKNSDIPVSLQRTIGKTSAKVPGWDYHQIPYIDAWGDPQENADSETWNVITQLFSPSYVTREKQSATLDELTRLYDVTSDNSVILNTAPKYFQLNGQTKQLTADEYVTYAMTRGSTAKAGMADLIESSAYQRLPDEEKVTAIEKLYDYANQVGKAAVSDFVPESWVRKAQDAQAQYGITPAQFILARNAVNATSGVKDLNGNTIEGTPSLKKMEVLYGMPGLTDAQRKALAEDFDVSKTVREYSREEFQTALSSIPTTAQMQEQQRHVNEITDTLKQSGLWGQATPEQQEKVLQMAQDIVTPEKRIFFTNPGEGYQAKVEAGADTGLDDTSYIMYQLALKVNDQPNENGKTGTYTNEEVEAAIRAVPGLSNAARDYLWIAQGKNPKSTPIW